MLKGREPKHQEQLSFFPLRQAFSRVSSCGRAWRQTRLGDMGAQPCYSALGHWIGFWRGCGSPAVGLNYFAVSRGADHRTDDDSSRTAVIGDNTGRPFVGEVEAATVMVKDAVSHLPVEVHVFKRRSAPGISRGLFFIFVCRECPVFGNWYGRALAVACLDNLIAEQIPRIVDHHREVMARRTAQRLVNVIGQSAGQ